MTLQHEKYAFGHKNDIIKKNNNISAFLPIESDFIKRNSAL